MSAPGDAELVFFLHRDAPPLYVQRWKKLREKFCENSLSERERSRVLASCTLKHLRDMPCLDRHEGGFGGEVDATSKQLRFVCNTWPNCPGLPDRSKDICVRTLNPDGPGAEAWQWNEIEDVRESVTRFIIGEMRESCVASFVRLEL